MMNIFSSYFTVGNWNDRKRENEIFQQLYDK